MRAPRRRRPRTTARITPRSQDHLDALAAKATYTPGAEHKDYLTSAGPGRLRSDASACPRDLHLDRVAGWLREALRAGQASEPHEEEFPRYVWTRDGDRFYEARLCDSVAEEYEGYPILASEAPDWLA